MEFNITTINDIVNFDNIINQNYLKELKKNILSIDYQILEYKINNMRYECFNHIQSFEDLNKLKFFDFINFIIDNRYDIQNLITFKDDKNLSDIEVTRLINIKNFNSWFNYYSIIAIISKSMAQKK